MTFDVDACAQEYTRADASAEACMVLARTHGCVRSRAVDERDASCEARSVVSLPGALLLRFNACVAFLQSSLLKHRLKDHQME